MAETRIFHLITGEDLIGTAERTSAGWRIENPLRPHIEVDPATGAGRIGLVPVLPFADGAGGMTVLSEHVVFSLPPLEQMANIYQQMTGRIMLASVGALPAGSAKVSLL